MSRSYRVLAAALVGMLVLVGLAQLTDGDRSGSAPASAPPTAPPAAATTPASGDVPTATDTPLEVTDIVDGDVAPSSTVASTATADCSITEVLKVGSTGEQVSCLQSQLTAGGFGTALTDGAFDAATDVAVKSYQTANSLQVDGIVGRQTAQLMGIWAGPTGPAAATNADCPTSPHGAIIDRANQRGWLCSSGILTKEFPITSAWSQPDPGTYKVYARDLKASSNLTGQYSTMTHFVAFTKGKYQGARIAFHSIPKYSNGQYVQPLDSVGTAARHGESSGCIRVLPDDAVAIWDWLALGDSVRVIS